MSIPLTGSQFPSYHPSGHVFQFRSSSNTAYQLSGSPPVEDFTTSIHDLSPNDIDLTIYQYLDSSLFSDPPPPTPLYEAEPVPQNTPSIGDKTVRRLRSGNRVPRPRNAFMIFRSEFWAGEKISRTVEHDHRHISRIIGHCWNQLPEEEKDVWRRKAEKEKEEHTKKYPGYRFSPATRLKKPMKRNVKRNGEEELLRCKKVAELLLAGKQGEELDSALTNLSLQKKDGAALGGVNGPTETSDPSPKLIGYELDHAPFPNHKEAPIFRGPLLPPSGARPDTSPFHYDFLQPSSTSYDENTLGYMLPPGYPSSNAPTYGEASYESLYPPQTQANGWAQIPLPLLDMGYYPSLGYIWDPPVGDLYFSSPMSNISFTNPFDYSTHIPPSFPQNDPIDPLHWDISHEIS